MCQHLRVGEAVLLAVILVGAASLEAPALKRAPSGFMGMRGKKYAGDEMLFDDLEKRAPGMGFQGMRGKKDSDVNEAFDDLDKRAPNMGFQGVRGKKAEDSDVFEKRAPGMGFQGMRGKKDQELGYDTDFELPGLDHDLDLVHMAGDDEYKMDADDIWGEGFEKRAPSGFFGMRGKKQPTSGFFGMRGKKAPSGFMGMRGKKAPSGFMGMRGKKDDGSNLDLFLESLEADELRDQADAQLRHLEEDDSTNVRQKRYRGPKNIKKAPSGFVGMRGKKWNSGLEARGPLVGETL